MRSSIIALNVALCGILSGFVRNADALPQPVKISFSPSTNSANFERFTSKTVLQTSKLVGVSPLALCAGAASFISGFDVGIIAGALLLLVPAFGLANAPHRCEDSSPLPFHSMGCLRTS